MQLDGEGNHVHLLVNYPPKVSVSSLVNSLKGVSSYVLRRQLPRIAKCYWKNVLWSPSYFAASCGGAPLDGIKRYIEQQATPLESRLTPAGSPGLAPLTGGQLVRGMGSELVSDLCVHQASDRVKAAQIPSRPAQPTAMI